MNRKITETEFKNWAEKILEIEKTTVKTLSEGPEKEKAENCIVVIVSNIKNGNTFALAMEVIGMLKNIKSLNDPTRYVKYNDLGNLTLEEWLTNLKNRIEEHHKRRRNYSVDASSLFNLFNQGKSEVLKKRRHEILGFIKDNDKEGYEIIWKFVCLIDNLKKIGFGNDLDSEEEKEFAEIVKEFPYLFEDIIKTVEEGKQKLQEYENSLNSGRSSSNPNPPSSQNSEQTNSQINQLETQVGQIQKEIDKLGNSSQEDDKIKQKELENQLTDLKAEIESLRQRSKLFPPKPNQEQNKENKDNNKLNWAIGLGIGAGVIGLICLILLASRREKDN